MRESQIEQALKRRVETAGCEIRKVGWIGRHSCPDRLIMLTPHMSAVWGFPRSVWVETKRPTKDANEAQAREHARMRACGEIVLVINTLEGVDRWFPVHTPSWSDYELNVMCTNRLTSCFPVVDLAALKALSDFELRSRGFRARDVKEIREMLESAK